MSHPIISIYSVRESINITVKTKTICAVGGAVSNNIVNMNINLKATYESQKAKKEKKKKKGKFWNTSHFVVHICLKQVNSKDKVKG